MPQSIRSAFLLLLGCFFIAPLEVDSAEGQPDYLQLVRTFGKTLQKQARPLPPDSIHLPPHGAWPLVTEPFKTELSTHETVRPYGNANLLYESSTLHLFRVLSEVTDDGTFRLASNAYVEDYFKHAQHSKSGLIAWGPELSLDLTKLQVNQLEQTANHRLLARTTPWEVLWDTDPQATAQAIQGLEKHFKDPADPFFSVEAPYESGQRAIQGNPHCLHAGLFTHAFAFMYQKTGQRRWLDQAKLCTELFFDRRDEDTGLIATQLHVDQITAKAASSQQMMFGYLLLKSWRTVPHETDWGKSAVALIKAYDRAAYDPVQKNWHAYVSLNGKPLTRADLALNSATGNSSRSSSNSRIPSLASKNHLYLPIWEDQQGDRISVAMVGRIAAYAAGVTGDATCLEIAKRAEETLARSHPTVSTTTSPMAFALGLNLDLYDLTRDKKHLTSAERLAAHIMKTYWQGKTFSHLPNGKNYDARYHIGDLAAALLRLHIRTHRFRPAQLYDWTF